MEDFSTAFFFADNLVDLYIPLYVRLLIGVVFSIGSVALFIFIRRYRRVKLSIFGPTILFGILWFGIHALIFHRTYNNVQHLLSVYNNNQYGVIEGEVQVLHEQPETGHDDGDIIEINGKTLEIDYFVATVGYKDTIAYGGVLKDGVYARIYYYEDTILRIDLKN